MIQTGPCEYVMADYSDCGGAAVRGVSVRHGECCDWDVWPVCSLHEAALRADLAELGLLICTEVYPLGDDEARRSAEALAMQESGR